MKTRQKRGTGNSVEQALKDISVSAKRKAFRHNRPVAVSINSRPFLIYPDGSQKPVTPKLLRELRDGHA